MAINVRYFAALREQSNKSQETLQDNFKNPKDLYNELSNRYNFSLNIEQVKVSINGKYANWDAALKNHDLVVFIPPVAGG